MKTLKSCKGHLFALLCVLFWGTSFLFSKTLLQSFSCMQLMWCRFAIAYIALWICYPKWYFQWKDELFFFLISLFANTLYYLCENSALEYTQTSNVSILVATAPIFTAILLRVFAGEKIQASRVFGFILSFAGVILVVFNGVFNLKLNPLGDFLSLCAAVSWAVYGLLARNFASRFNSFLISRKIMFYGILSITPFLLTEEGGMDFLLLINGSNLLDLLYLGLICSAGCYILWDSSMKSLGVMAANIYIYVVPVVTLLAGAFVLSETITLLGVLGIILVIAGLAVSTDLPWKNKSLGVEEP